MRSLLRLTLLGLLTAGVLAEGKWRPASAYVLIASITRWPAPAGLSPLLGTRRDAELVNQFVDAGVPEDNILFFKDKQATQAAIRTALVYLAERTRRGDTLIFYFQGHGGRQHLYCYDYAQDSPDHAGLAMADLYPLLQRPLKADRLFLIGDSCCSGSLSGTVKQFEGGRPDVRVAALASAAGTDQSIGNWTFSEGLLRVLAGDPLVDTNRDGKLSLEEAGRFLQHQMKFRENQLSRLTLSKTFEKGFVLRSTSAKAHPKLVGPYQIGDILEARDAKDRWHPAEISNANKDRFLVRYNTREELRDEWLDSAHLRPIVKASLDVGGRYEVIRQNIWYPATLTKAEDNFYLAQFENGGGEEEWISPDRARPLQQQSFEPGFKAPMDSNRPGVGDSVAARWRKFWYRARIKDRSRGAYTVQYDDGSIGRVSLGDLIPIALDAKVGDRVLACWGQDGRMVGGRVVAVKEGQATIQWEDGRSTSEVSLDRMARIRP